MVRMAADHGSSDLVATPARQSHLQVRCRELVQEGVWPPSRRHPATFCASIPAAIFTSATITSRDAIANPRKYTINQQRYLMVEFSDLLIFANTQEIFSGWKMSGMTPVITHPERNNLLRQRIDHIAQWVEAGRLCASYGYERAGRLWQAGGGEFARNLLDRQLVHFSG